LGCRTPQQVTQEASCEWAARTGVGEAQRLDEWPSLEEKMPGLYAQLLRWQDIVENHFEDVKSLEFAVEKGKLWFLQAHTSEQALCELPAAFKPELLVAEPAEMCSQDTEDPSLHASHLVDDVQEKALDVQADSFSTQSTECPALSLELTEGMGLEEESPGNSNAFDVKQVCGPTCQGPQSRTRGPAFSSPAGMLWKALRSLGSKGRNVCGPAACVNSAGKDADVEDNGRKVAEGMLATPCGLPLWQTGLAGGAAAVACRFTSQLTHMKYTPGSSMSMARAASFGAGRAFPFGSVCCSFYTNLCAASPADDLQNGFSPLWRLGCAATAVTSATVLTQVGASQGSLRLPPMFTGLVPTLAIEMCVIDLVKNTAVERGHDVSPAVLVTSGAIAGTVSQTIMHPLSVLSQRTAVPAISSGAAASAALRVVTKEGASALFAGLGPACLRSIPVVAMNSLVRVGMTTHFLGLSSN